MNEFWYFLFFLLSGVILGYFLLIFVRFVTALVIFHALLINSKKDEYDEYAERMSDSWQKKYSHTKKIAKAFAIAKQFMNH